MHFFFIDIRQKGLQGNAFSVFGNVGYRKKFLTLWVSSFKKIYPRMPNFRIYISHPGGLDVITRDDFCEKTDNIMKYVHSSGQDSSDFQHLERVVDHMEMYLNTGGELNYSDVLEFWSPDMRMYMEDKDGFLSIIRRVISLQYVFRLVSVNNSGDTASNEMQKFMQTLEVMQNIHVVNALQSPEGMQTVFMNNFIDQTIEVHLSGFAECSDIHLRARPGYLAKFMNAIVKFEVVGRIVASRVSCHYSMGIPMFVDAHAQTGSIAQYEDLCALMKNNGEALLCHGPLNPVDLSQGPGHHFILQMGSEGTTMLLQGVVSEHLHAKAFAICEEKNLQCGLTTGPIASLDLPKFVDFNPFTFSLYHRCQSNLFERYYPDVPGRSNLNFGDSFRFPESTFAIKDEKVKSRAKAKPKPKIKCEPPIHAHQSSEHIVPDDGASFLKQSSVLMSNLSSTEASQIPVPAAPSTKSNDIIPSDLDTDGVVDPSWNWNMIQDPTEFHDNEDIQKSFIKLNENTKELQDLQDGKSIAKYKGRAVRDRGCLSRGRMHSDKFVGNHSKRVKILSEMLIKNPLQIDMPSLDVGDIKISTDQANPCFENLEVGSDNMGVSIQMAVMPSLVNQPTQSERENKYATCNMSGFEHQIAKSPKNKCVEKDGGDSAFACIGAPEHLLFQKDVIVNPVYLSDSGQNVSKRRISQDSSSWVKPAQKRNLIERLASRRTK